MTFKIVEIIEIEREVKVVLPAIIECPIPSLTKPNRQRDNFFWQDILIELPHRPTTKRCSTAAVIMSSNRRLHHTRDDGRSSRRADSGGSVEAT
jgi:hypothetical protein